LPPATVWRGPEIGAVPVTDAYEYRYADGVLLGYVCRIYVGRKKETIPHCWSREDGRWRQGAFPTPRPLYGLPILAGADRVLLVEGEKACNAARTLVLGFACVTWPGGCGALHHVDWAPLAGKEVWLWPDCDSQRFKAPDPRAGELKPYHEQPGTHAMDQIGAFLLALGCTVHLIEVPAPGIWCDGFDLADALADGWNRHDVKFYMAEHSITLAIPTDE
jgi:hypothetical protein